MGDELIGRQIGNYTVKELLGKGGMGSVYLAEHPRIGREVAVKVLSGSLFDRPGATQRFETEARVISKMEHPNIVNLFDFGTLEDGRPYYVMERLRGVDLQQVIDRMGKLTPEDLYPYVVQICRGLHAAHVKGVVHRDLKPKNIFVVDGPELLIKLLDFGIAKLLEPTEQDGASTGTGEVIGTPRFISPEQAGGYSSSVGPRTDLYSLGVMLYLILSGELPFDDQSPVMLLASHLKSPPTDIRQREPAVPPALADLVHACLEKDPLARPSSAAEVAARFANVIGQTPDPLLSAAATLPERLSQYEYVSNELKGVATTLRHTTGEKVTRAPVGRKRRPLLLVLAAAVGLALTAATYLAYRWYPAPADPRPPVALRPSSSAPPPLPADAAVVRRTIRVHVTSVAAVCELYHGAQRTQRMTNPCQMELQQGRRVKLVVTAAGLRPFLKEWRVAGDLDLALREMGGALGVDVVAPDAGIRARKGPRGGTRRTPPPATQRTRPDRIGEGTLEIDL